MRPLLFVALLACSPKGGGSVGTGTDTPKGPACEITASVDHAQPGATAIVDLASSTAPFEQRRLQARVLSLGALGGATLVVEGGVSVVDESGAQVATVDPSDAVSLLILGEASGPATVQILPPAGCATDPVDLALEVRPAPDLAGRLTLGGPGFSFTDHFNADEAVLLGLDSRDYPDRVGLEADAYVVPHRSAEAWATEPGLGDVAGGPVRITLAEGRRAESAVALWDSDLPVPAGEHSAAWDVVLDFGLDGRLDPGDPIDGLYGPGFHGIADLTAPGPHGTIQGEHSVGYWTTMRVYAPDVALPDPAPLVVISHGNGHDYTWYDYLGNHLASWGYVVISHRNDTGPGPITAAGTTLSNTDAFLRDAPSLGLPVSVDGSKIAWIGHSRGGEGVVLAYNALAQGAAGVTEFTAADVLSVHSIAPTLFEDPDSANPGPVSYHLIAGSADGDVTGGVDTSIVQYFRIFQRGTGDHWVTYVQGADHNDFNCCGPDDGTWFTVQGNPPLIGSARAQAVAKSYLLALLERDLRGNDALTAYFARSPELFAPLGTDATIATQAMPGASAAKFVIDDFQTENATETSSSGGAVSRSIGAYGEGAMDDNNTLFGWSNSDQANGMTWSHNDANPERGAIAEWAVGEDAWVEWEITEAQADWSALDALSFRACEGTRHPATQALGDYLSFSVALVDGSGNEAAIDLAAYGRITPPYPRGGLGNGSGWANEFQTVKIPLQDFRAGATQVDLADVVAVRLHFGEAWGSAQGRIGLDDLEVVSR